MTLEDRRTAPRVAAAYQITFECFRQGVQVSQGTARTVNISDNGALVEMPYAVDLDTSLILSINAPFYTLVARGDVVHARQIASGVYHIGIKLTDMIEGDWSHLKLDVLQRLEEEPDARP